MHERKFLPEYLFTLRIHGQRNRDIYIQGNEAVDYEVPLGVRRFYPSHLSLLDVNVADTSSETKKVNHMEFYWLIVSKRIYYTAQIRLDILKYGLPFESGEFV